jgi:cation diffusion facilitator family transporter
MTSRRTVVFAAILANLAIAATKFVAAAITRSSAMLSEAIHSLVDTGNGLLLLVGIKRAAKPPDALHPFGHGLELYFWTLLVAILIFGAGGGMSFYEGIVHLTHPREPGDPFWGYVVIAAALVFESTSFVIAFRGFRAVTRGRGFWRAVRESKDPPRFLVVFEDSAAIIGLLVAAAGLFLSQRFRNPVWDGIASLVIGLVLAGVATFLVLATRRLLIGETADPSIVNSIRQIVEADPAAMQVGDPMTMHLGPEAILLNLDIQFRDGLSSGELEAAIDRLERRIRKAHPRVHRIFLEARSLATGPPSSSSAPSA